MFKKLKSSNFCEKVDFQIFSDGLKYIQLPGMPGVAIPPFNETR